MGHRYLVLGSGMQGCAAGYYLGRFGDAAELCFADRSREVAETAAQRVGKLLGRSDVRSLELDAKKHKDLVSAFSKYDAVLSAIDYSLNVSITEAAIEAGVHLCDLGGNTDIVRKQLELSSGAREKNISIVPDCGLAPGLGNTLAAYGIELLDECESVKIRCGGLPQNPKGPLLYKLVFNIRGLTNEYFGKAWALKDNQLVEIDTFTDLEELEFAAPVGRCEAFVTTGGTSVAPWTFRGKVKNYNYKTVRYPGHYEKMKCMLELGLLDLDPIKVGDSDVIPREVFHAVATKTLNYPEDKDLVVLRVECEGKKDGQAKKIHFELMDFQDEETGFSAMERTTGFPAALVLIYCARGQAKKGVIALETAIPNADYTKELISNGLEIKQQI